LFHLLIADMLLKEKKITMLGTLQANRVGQPRELVKDTKKEEFSYEVFWDESNGGALNLHCYTCVNKSTGKKNVILLTTQQPILGTEKNDREKRPAVIVLYNYIKGGTDIGKSNFYLVFIVPTLHTLKMLQDTNIFALKGAAKLKR